MEQEKKTHEVYEIHSQGLTHEIYYQCAVCKADRKTKEELEGKECGGLPPLGFGVGDKAPSRDRFGGSPPPPVKKAAPVIEDDGQPGYVE